MVLCQSTLVIISEGICGKLSVNDGASLYCKSYWLLESLPASELKITYILKLGEDEKTLHRTIQVDGKSDFVYYIEEIAPFAFRFRYRGDQVPAKDYALFNEGRIIASTLEPPLDRLPIEDIEADSLGLNALMLEVIVADSSETVPVVEKKDTVKRIEIVQPPIPSLQPNNMAKSMLKGEHIVNEFDRFLFCKRMAMGSEKLDEDWVRHLCSILRYDQSRLDFLRSIAPRYVNNEWFEGLQDVLKFDALKLEFIQVIKDNKLDE